MQAVDRDFSGNRLPPAAIYPNSIYRADNQSWEQKRIEIGCTVLSKSILHW